MSLCWILAIVSVVLTSCSCVVMVIESSLLITSLLCSHVMLGIGDPVTEQLNVKLSPVAGKMTLDGIARKLGGAGGTKI